MGDFSRQWLQGYREIYSVFIVQRVRSWCRRRGHGRLWLLYLALVAQWPTAVNVLLLLLDRSHAAATLSSTYWLLSFGGINLLMLCAANSTWTFTGERMRLIDEIITDSSARASAVKWLAKYMAHRHQMIMPLLGATSGPLFLYVIRGQMTSVVAVGIPSYLMVSWTSFIGGNVAYWLWVAPGIAKRLYRCRGLALRWQDPASTPGIRLLADGLGVAALFLLAGVATISIMGFWLPRLTIVSSLSSLLYIFFALAVITTFRVVVLPFMWTWGIIVRAKRNSLTIISSHLPSLPLPRRRLSDADVWLSAYQLTLSAPSLPFSTGVVVQYGAAFAGSVFAFVLGVITAK